MGYINHAGGVTPEFLKAGRYEVGVNGRRVPARLHLRAPYDPDRFRILT